MLQERDLPLVVGPLQATQERAQPRDRGETGEQRSGRTRSAAGDAGGAAEGVDEGRPGELDGDAGAAGDVGDAVGLRDLNITGVTPQGPQFGMPGVEVNLLYIAGLLSLLLGGPGPLSVDERVWKPTSPLRLPWRHEPPARPRPA